MGLGSKLLDIAEFSGLDKDTDFMNFLVEIFMKLISPLAVSFNTYLMILPFGPRCVKRLQMCDQRLCQANLKRRGWLSVRAHRQPYPAHQILTALVFVDLWGS